MSACSPPSAVDRSAIATTASSIRDDMYATNMHARLQGYNNCTTPPSVKHMDVFDYTFMEVCSRLQKGAQTVHWLFV